MNGKIRLIETVGSQAGTPKEFTESFARDIFFGMIFQKKTWGSIEPNVAVEDRVRAKQLFEEELAQFISLTNTQPVVSKIN